MRRKLFNPELQLRSTPVQLHQANENDDPLSRLCDKRAHKSGHTTSLSWIRRPGTTKKVSGKGGSLSQARDGSLRQVLGRLSHDLPSGSSSSSYEIKRIFSG